MGQAKADQAAEENKSQIELGTDTDHENDDKKEKRSDNLQSPRSKTDDDEMKSAISHKSEATVVSGRTEKTPKKHLSEISASEKSEEEEEEEESLAPETERPEKRPRESTTSERSEDEKEPQSPRESEEEKER